MELETKPIEFVLPYTQSDVKPDIYTELLLIFGVDISHRNYWVIKLPKNVYGLRRGPAQEVPFLYTPSNLSEIQSCRSTI